MLYSFQIFYHYKFGKNKYVCLSVHLREVGGLILTIIFCYGISDRTRMLVFKMRRVCSDSHWSLFMRRMVGPCGSRISCILQIFSIRLTSVIVFRLRTSHLHTKISVVGR